MFNNRWVSCIQLTTLPAFNIKRGTTLCHFGLVGTWIDLAKKFA